MDRAVGQRHCPVRSRMRARQDRAEDHRGMAGSLRPDFDDRRRDVGGDERALDRPSRQEHTSLGSRRHPYSRDPGRLSVTDQGPRRLGVERVAEPDPRGLTLGDSVRSRPTCGGRVPAARPTHAIGWPTCPSARASFEVTVRRQSVAFTFLNFYRGRTAVVMCTKCRNSIEALR